MTWTNCLNQGRVERHTPSRREIDDLRSLVTRNLKDAAILGLSADNRLGLAYEAALILAKMAVTCVGYRVKGQGHHKTMFEVLPLAMGPSLQRTADFFEHCRRKRNSISYDAAGTVSESEADAALDEAMRLSAAVEAWIAVKHPNFRR